MKKMIIAVVAPLLFWGAGTLEVVADVRLSPVFGDHMVLQRDRPARLSGWADEGEKVVVKLGGQTVAETSGAGTGTAWVVTLPVMRAGKIADITVVGKNTITLKNLLAGDVWLCSGQSNMAMELQRSKNGTQEVAQANHATLRLYRSDGKQNRWTACTPETARDFSAVGYFFGRELMRQLDVPVGLVLAAVGGTPVEYWTPRDAGDEARIEAARNVIRELKPQADADAKAWRAWVKLADEAKKAGRTAPEKATPVVTAEQKLQLMAAGYCEKTGQGYDAFIKPVVDMTIAGVIWYQGEANTPLAADYEAALTRMIEAWRKEWGLGEFPFLLMQLPNYNSGYADAWAKLRVAQQAVADTVPNAGIAIGIDIGNSRDHHPTNKLDAGLRLARVALKQVYGRDLVAAGPKPVEVRFGAGKVSLTFDQPVVMKTSGGGFEVAGDDGRFMAARAKADGKTITVAAPTVAIPRVVRYACHNDPAASVFNAEGLPAAPFMKPDGGTRP